MDDYVKAHQGVTVFDDEWHKKLKPTDPRLIKELLLSKIPKNGKYDPARKLVDEVCNRSLTTKNFYIARKIWRNRGNRGKSVLLKIKDYQTGKVNYSQKIKNLHKTVRGLIEPIGYAVSFNEKQDTTRILLMK